MIDTEKLCDTIEQFGDNIAAALDRISQRLDKIHHHLTHSEPFRHRENGTTNFSRFK
jgi:hypothetical protein